MSKTKFALQIISALVLLAIIAIMLIPNTRVKVLNFFNHDKVETVQEQQIVNEAVTIEDILQFRKDIIESEFYDSVFLYMPETPLIAILIKKGTDLSNSEIAKEYLDNKKYYDDVEFGAQIHQIYRRQIEPDTIPNLLPPDSVTPNITELKILFVIILLYQSVKIDIAPSEDDKHVGRK